MEGLAEKIEECFGKTLAAAVRRYPDELCEIRIRADKPVVLCLLNRPYFIGAEGELCPTACENAVTVGFDELKAAFARLCSYSVYKHMQSIGSGFITLPGGHRVGVCGTAVMSGNDVRAVSEITSLNIRSAKEFPGCCEPLFRSVDLLEGMLICGAPSSGKTTLLRDAARKLSFEMLRRVSVIDERLELASSVGGHSGFDVGLSDVYSGYPKSTAMLLAVRTMSPEFIICDELTGEDAAAVSRALNCGVSVISSVHCTSLQSALKNPSVKALTATGAFRKLVFLSGSIPPEISGIIDTEEVKNAKA